PGFRNRHHLLLIRGDRKLFDSEAIDCGSSIGIDEGRKRLHEMPGGAVHSGFVARVNVLYWPASPTLAAGSELTFDDAFRAERDRHLAIESLRCVRHEDANAPLERSLHFRLIDNLYE